MSLLNKNKKKKPLRTLGGAASTAQSSLRPRQVSKAAPCATACPSGTDIRLWLQAISQREKLGLSEEEAFERAWRIVVDTNPFPAVMGRVCPHPCETACNRTAKEGAVSINHCERFIGDWALQRGLALTGLDEEAKSASVGVIGAGPSGLSFAYQMARRGYPVTVYEKTDKPGGMIFWGIPFYRQPAEVLEAEVRRIVDLGVAIEYNCEVGKDIPVEALKSRHQALYIGIGAHKARRLMVPGEEGAGVFPGTAYLHQVNAKERVEVGEVVAIIGGGDTAIDAARAARRSGAAVTVFYRRTREEMPAIAPEIEDALKEGIRMEYLAAPVAIKREGDRVVGMTVRRMALGEPDASGRRRPVPIEGSDFDLAVDTVIAAISQEPEGAGLHALYEGASWIATDESFQVAEGIWAGGDAVRAGLVTDAVGHGRQAAIRADAALRGVAVPSESPKPPIPKTRIKMDNEEVYPTKGRAEGAHRPPEEWLSKPDDEINLGITNEQFIEETTRCFSCGQCFDCERCWMYCTPGCFKKAPTVSLGQPYYIMKLDTCDGCKKCDDECPCGFMDMV